MVDRILVLSEGRISECGTYEQLISHDGEFAAFLRQHMLHDEADSDDEDPEGSHKTITNIFYNYFFFKSMTIYSQYIEEMSKYKSKKTKSPHKTKKQKRHVFNT